MASCEDFIDNHSTCSTVISNDNWLLMGNPHPSPTTSQPTAGNDTVSPNRLVSESSETDSVVCGRAVCDDDQLQVENNVLPSNVSPPTLHPHNEKGNAAGASERRSPPSLTSSSQPAGDDRVRGPSCSSSISDSHETQVSQANGENIAEPRGRSKKTSNQQPSKEEHNFFKLLLKGFANPTRNRRQSNRDDDFDVNRTSSSSGDNSSNSDASSSDDEEAMSDADRIRWFTYLFDRLKENHIEKQRQPRRNRKRSYDNGPPDRNSSNVKLPSDHRNPRTNDHGHRRTPLLPTPPLPPCDEIRVPSYDNLPLTWGIHGFIDDYHGVQYSSNGWRHGLLGERPESILHRPPPVRQRSPYVEPLWSDGTVSFANNQVGRQLGQRKRCDYDDQQWRSSRHHRRDTNDRRPPPRMRPPTKENKDWSSENKESKNKSMLCRICNLMTSSLSTHRHSMDHKHKERTVRRGCLLCKSGPFDTYQSYLNHMDGKVHIQRKQNLDKKVAERRFRESTKSSSYSHRQSSSSDSRRLADDTRLPTTAAVTVPGQDVINIGDDDSNYAVHSLLMLESSGSDDVTNIDVTGVNNSNEAAVTVGSETIKAAILSSAVIQLEAVMSLGTNLKKSSAKKAMDLRMKKITMVIQSRRAKMTKRAENSWIRAMRSRMPLARKIVRLAIDRLREVSYVQQSFQIMEQTSKVTDVTTIDQPSIKDQKPTMNLDDDDDPFNRMDSLPSTLLAKDDNCDTSNDVTQSTADETSSSVTQSAGNSNKDEQLSVNVENFIPVGTECIVPATGFFCLACMKFWPKKLQALSHCSSEIHCQNFILYNQQKTLAPGLSEDGR